MAGAMRLGILAGVFGAALVAAPAARAQMDSREGIALQNQILELRRDLQAMQQRGGAPAPYAPPRGGGSGGDTEITAQLLDRVVTLEDQLRRQRGQLDDLANQVRRQNDDLAKQLADLNFRLQNGGGSSAGSTGGGGGGAGPVVPPTAPPGSSGSVRRTPELAMQEGNAALARRDYATAEASAREILADGRATPRAADAGFLLAQAMYGKRDYQAAAVAFDDAYNRSRTGSRAPDALLGLAASLLAINERPAGCATLDKLRAEFPNQRADVREQSAALRGRGGCR